MVETENYWEVSNIVIDKIEDSNYNLHNLTLHNLFVSRLLVELIKVLKLHSPSPVYESIQFCSQTHHFRLLKS